MGAVIYCDCAATSYPRAPGVAQAMAEALETMASPGRGDHALAALAANCVYTCRERLAQLFSMDRPEHVVLVGNATHALNIAIRSRVHRGTRVLISGFEHNAVTRPLQALGAQVTVMDTPLFDPEAVLRCLHAYLPQTDVVVMTHVSNVFGYILPLEEVGRMCHAAGVPLIVDASQSAGVLPIDFGALHAHFVCMPGHKGLLGPQGTGVLLSRDDTVTPLLYGGSGTDSRSPHMPDCLPERIEAGTANVPGIAGLSAAIAFLLEQSPTWAQEREIAHRQRFVRACSQIKALRLYTAENDQLGVLSLTAAGYTPEELAEALDAKGVAVRAGLHCAPLAHDTAGTLPGGTVRFSFSPFLTDADVDTAASTLASIIQTA